MTEPSHVPEVRTRAVVLAASTCIGFMLLGSLFGWLTTAEPDLEWYEGLVRPAFEPPAVLVLLVHLLYYPLFFVLFFRAFSLPHDRGTRRRIVGLALGAMAIYTAWNPLLVGFRALVFGVAGNVVLFGVVGLLALVLRRQDRLSALLLLPYLLWVAFDVLWSFELLRLNP